MSEVLTPSFESHPLPHVDNYLDVGQKGGASDIHVGVAAPPIWRVNGTLQPMWSDAPVLTGEQTVALAETFMPEVYKEELNTRGDADFAYENEHARYRVSVVRQRLGVEMVFRVISTSVRTMDDLGLPEQLKLLTRYQNGLVLATGHHRNGILLAPVTADAIARLIDTGDAGVDLAPFSVARFERPGS